MAPASSDAANAFMHPNVLGAMQVLPQIMPMVEEAGGVFAAISSAMSQIGSVPNSSAWLYRVSKAAVNMVVRSAQAAYPDLTLVALHPGWVRTNMGGAGAALAPEESARDLRQVLSGLSAKHKGQYLNHDGSVIPW